MVAHGAGWTLALARVASKAIPYIAFCWADTIVGHRGLSG